MTHAIASEEAERSVVGAVIVVPKKLAEVADLLRPEHFHHRALGAIYEAILDLDAAGKPIEPVTIRDRMTVAGTIFMLKAHGGEAFFGELTGAFVTAENIRYHAETIRRDAASRRVVEAAGEVIALGRTPEAREDGFADRAGQIVLAATLSAVPSSTVALRKALRPVIKDIEARYERKEVVTGVPSGLTELDAITAGFQPDDLVILAARPAMGKTSLVMNAAINAAISHQIPSLVFSLEMSHGSLIERALASEARVDSTRLRSGFLTAADWPALTRAAARIADLPIHFDDAGSPTLLEIRSKARRWRADPTIFPTGKEKGAVVVDYLQLITPTGNGKNTTNDQVSEISRGLKALAKELHLPVVALSQLNRKCEERQDKRPILSDLRDSGAVEQDADLIMFLYRDEVYNKESPDKGTAEIIIGKQRKGPTGTVKVAFLNQFTRFENLEHRYGGGNFHPGED